MTKRDLRTGMIVTTANGEEYMVMLGFKTQGIDEDVIVIRNREGGYNKLSRYNDDLTHVENPDYDIVKVALMAKAKRTFADDAVRTEDAEVIWKKVEEVEDTPVVTLTLADIQEALGFAVRITL